VKIDRPGLYPHILPADYHNDPCPRPSLSNSKIKILATQTPLHAWTATPGLNPDWKPGARKDHYDRGTAAHALLLGRGTDLVHVSASRWNKAEKLIREQAEAEGKTALLTDDYNALVKMVRRGKERLAEYGITLDPARSEIMAVAEINGVWCRILVDNAPEWPTEPLYDYKTTTDANKDACFRTVERLGYDIQKRFYQRVWKAATGEDRDFRFIFQEVDPPNSLTVHRLHESDANSDGTWDAAADLVIDEALETWRVCVDTDTWPDYPVQVWTLYSSRFHAEKREDRRTISAETIRRATAWQSPTGGD
jgi:hypothetical protein